MFVAIWTTTAFIRSFWVRRRQMYRFLCALTALIALSEIQFFTEKAVYVPAFVCYIGIPLLVLLFVLCLFTGHGSSIATRSGLAEAHDLGYWELRGIGRSSIKECVDMLPMGICCYYPDGQIKLVNNMMNLIASDLTGHSLADGTEFIGCLRKLSMESEERRSIVVRLKNGRIFSFREKEIISDGIVINELLANDISKEYELTEALREKEKNVAQLNEKLKSIEEESLKTAIEKEVLDAKIRVHDNLGRVILMTRRYLKKDQKEDREAENIAAEIIRQTVLLRGESPDEWRRDYDYIFRTAKMLGVEIEIKGELPASGKAEKLAVSALSCTLLNSARHAGADRLFAEVERFTNSTGNYCLMRITDNGKVSNVTVTEKGGLSNLRREIEAGGGSLEIEAENGIAVHVLIPEER